MILIYFYRIAGILPHQWEQDHLENPKLKQPEYSLTYTIFKFVIKFKNLIDLAAIVPRYVYLLYPTSNTGGFVRILKLFRIIRILRLLRLLSFFENADVATELIFESISQAANLLSVFLLFVVIIIIVFGW